MRVRRYVSALFAAALMSMGAVVVGAPASVAADFGPVTNTADDGSPTSLRSIIENDATNAGGDTVILASGADYLLDCDNGDLDHGSTPLTIEGNGATIRMEDGCGERVLTQGAALLTLRNVTIRDGGDGDGPDGAGFSAGGDVVLEGASIVDNHGDDAGGFEVDGTVEIYGSTISGNSTDESDWGGGFYAGSDVTIVESTISGNEADSDGGGGFVFECGADVMVVRSSITGNTAVGAGGGILEGCNIDGAPEPSTVTVVNSTISGNSAFTGGGIYTEFGTVNLVYTTLAANTATNVEPASAGVADDESDADDPNGDVRTLQGPVDNVIAGALGSFGTVVAYPTNGVNCEVFDGTASSGYNYADDASCGFDQATDTQNGADPLLGPLAANGGPTLTHLPQTGSPLVDAIPVAACGGGDALAGEAVASDQRGIARPQATGCEIGSVEIEAPVALEPAFTG